MSAPDTLERLRATIRRIERPPVSLEHRPVSLGAPTIDANLPWKGLPMARLHEIAGTAASGFAAALVGRVAASLPPGGLVWCVDPAFCRRFGELYGPGLAAFGIEGERLLLVRPRDRRQVFWAMEEALRCRAVACTVGEIDGASLEQSRRLQLAAEEGGGIGILLRGAKGDSGPLAATTRWSVDALCDERAGAGSRAGTSRSIGPWSADLWRVKGGAPRRWSVRWDERTLSFHDLAALADRADAPARPAHRPDARR
ncbi:MAG: hypothetical protein KDE35_01320 [Geminicoccaceae bacterium]|nr:hypothetical protein [Geminicoccaceae bacterium]